VVGRLVLTVFSSPRLLGFAMFFARVLRNAGVAQLLARLPGKVGAPFAMLASTAPWRAEDAARSVVAKAANGPPISSRGAHGAHGAHAAQAAHGAHVAHAGRVQGQEQSSKTPAALFEGCVMRELYAHVHTASRNVLRRNKYEIVSAPAQGCCGALHAHAGDLQKARELARKNIAAFANSGAARIAVNAAGCGAMLREYPQLLADDNDWLPRAQEFSARVSDITELLEARGPAPGAPLHLTVAYDAPCHLQHAQRVVSAPLAVLSAIPGLRVLQSPDNDKCCGAAGIYNLLEPDTSMAVLAPKLDELMQSDAQVVVTGNPGCMMQIGAGLIHCRSRIRTAHPIELLNHSYQNPPPPIPTNPERPH
jgi:glycolate oxidase iron-sulfur subunit